MIDVVRDLRAGSSLAQELYRFRYRVFVEHAGWQLPTQQRLEFDQFDTPQAVHLVNRASDGGIAGLLRLLPTMAPYMIERLWPDLLAYAPQPRSPRIWEVTRLGTDPDLRPHERGQAVAELVTACLEYGIDHGISDMLAVMTEEHARKVVVGLGWGFERCGPARVVGASEVIALRLRVSPSALANVRERTRLPHRLCRESRAPQDACAHTLPA